MKKATIITTAVISVALISTCCLAVVHLNGNKALSKASSAVEADKDSDSNSDFTYVPPTKSNKKEETEEVLKSFVPDRTLNLNRNSITFLVNKEYSLPQNYVPKDLVIPNVEFNTKGIEERMHMRAPAAKALEKLFNAAKEDNYYLVGVSGYRSYNRQYQIFTNNLMTKGKEHTLEYSAIPGTSEHQTGLSIDITSEALHDRLDASFANTPEGAWVSKNSYLYGFIIRYPKDKEDITGYAYEPWHIRYVGKGLAAYLYKHHMTLDEYYNYTPSKGFDFETKYAKFINFRPTPVPTRIPLPSLTPSPAPSPLVSPTVNPKKKAKVTVKPTPVITATPAKGQEGQNTNNSTTTQAPTPTPKAGGTETKNGQNKDGNAEIDDNSLIN